MRKILIVLAMMFGAFVVSTAPAQAHRPMVFQESRCLPGSGTPATGCRVQVRDCYRVATKQWYDFTYRGGALNGNRWNSHRPRTKKVCGDWYIPSNH